MNKALKAKWVEALRSGKYKQARHVLCDEKGALCCIGVGGVVANKRFKPAIGMATGPVANKLGLSEEVWNELVDRNDYEKHSFKQIANYIEKNL